MGIYYGEFMRKQLVTALLFLTFAIPTSVFSASEEEHKHDAVAESQPSSSKLESGKGWRVVRSVEMGASGKFIQLVLIDHNVYTDKTVYSAVINRLCNENDEFCRIRFWSQERFVPEKAAMTIEQNKQLRAEYLVNKAAGTKQLRWSCTVDPDKTHCF
ncbi:MAG TPA: hypothetical protein PLB54_00610 [Nitrosomonas sp.]|nr:hypothetical protein [Nitrosomonas sp.]